jgi:hypothetical protein
MPIRNLTKDLQRVAAIKLHNTRGVPKTMKDKLELIELAYGHADVIADFEKWCEEVAVNPPQYPVFDYIRMIDARLGTAQKADPHDPAIAEIQSLTYELTGVLPHTRAIRDLLGIHPAAEIKDALKEFVLTVDEKDMKSSIRAFFDDAGASAVIYAQQRRLQK